MSNKFVLFLLLLSVFVNLFSQNNSFVAYNSFAKSGFSYSLVNSLDFAQKPKNPRIATVLSATLPGAGQIYNGKFYKVPFIYAAGYFTITQFQKNNLDYKKYYHDHKVLDDSTSTEPLYMGITDVNILAQKLSETSRRRSLYALGTLLVWGLNVLDAYVDAELSNFDISEDLTLHIAPKIETFRNQSTVALSVKLLIK